MTSICLEGMNFLRKFNINDLISLLNKTPVKIKATHINMGKVFIVIKARTKLFDLGSHYANSLLFFCYPLNSVHTLTFLYILSHFPTKQSKNSLYIYTHILHSFSDAQESPASQFSPFPWLSLQSQLEPIFLYSGSGGERVSPRYTI